MEHRGPSEWVRCSSQTRHIAAVFSCTQRHETGPSRKVYFWKMSPNYTGGTSTGGKGSGASEAETGHAGAGRAMGPRWPLVAASLDCQWDLQGNPFVASIFNWELFSSAFTTCSFLSRV